MNLWGKILKWMGWKIDITAPRRDKCVICVAPHTSNLDFILGLCAYKSLGREANFLMKEFWFFFPLGLFMRKMGGIPVPAKRGSDLTAHLVEMFRNRSYVNLAVTPEGTRSLTSKWRKGFLYIAHDADVPVQLGVIDYHTKEIIIRDEYLTTGDIDADMRYVKSYYSRFKDAARYPDKFTSQTD